MWHEIVFQIDTEARWSALGLVAEVSRFPMLSMTMMMGVVGIVALRWNEALKDRSRQARWDKERANWNARIRIRR